jgi:hypothetical protein
MACLNFNLVLKRQKYPIIIRERPESKEAGCL